MRRWQTEVRCALGGLLALAVGATVLVPAPAGAADTSAYITTVAPHAQREAAQYGVPASVAIAQSILESGWGASTLTTQAKNYFGIKCPSNGDPAGSGSPYVTGCLAKPSYEYPGPVLVTSYFRVYASAQGSFLDHGYLLSSRSRYAAAFRYTTNPDQFVREVAAGGYATDPSYADLVIQIMKGHNLYRFDSTPQTSPPASSARPASSVPVGSASAPVVSSSARSVSSVPVVSSSAPVVSSSAPVVVSSAAPVTSAVVSSSPPVVSSSAAVTSSVAVSSSVPVSSSVRPVSSVPVSSSARVVSSSAPVVVSSAAVSWSVPVAATTTKAPVSVATTTKAPVGAAPATTLTGQLTATRSTTDSRIAAQSATIPAISAATARLAWARDSSFLRRAWRSVQPRGFASRWSWIAQEW